MMETAVAITATPPAGGTVSPVLAPTISKFEKQRAHGALLRAWMMSPQHFAHPYPTKADEQELMAQTGLTRKQVRT